MLKKKTSQVNGTQMIPKFGPGRVGSTVTNREGWVLNTRSSDILSDRTGHTSTRHIISFPMHILFQDFITGRGT